MSVEGIWIWSQWEATEGEWEEKRHAPVYFFNHFLWLEYHMCGGTSVEEDQRGGQRWWLFGRGCGGEEEVETKLELAEGLDVEAEGKGTIERGFQIAGLGPWMDGMPCTEKGNTQGRQRLLRLWGNQGFGFGRVTHGMSTKHLSGDAEWEACVECRETIWAGHRNWRVINTSVGF